MESHKKPKLYRFDPFYFVWTNLLTLAVIFAAWKILFPELWAMQLNASATSLLGSYIVLSLGYAFMEYFFHRYALHAKLFLLFSHFYTQHNIHHNHTNIVVVEDKYKNRYPIMEEEQLEASFFPWYAFALFAVAFSPILFVVAFFTSLPVLIVGYIALVVTIALYEGIHQLFHLPLSWWEPKLNHPQYGHIWRRIYAFHLDHHRNPGCNESVSGFFGFPIADVLFRTYFYSNTLYTSGSPVETALPAPKPILFIRMIDRLAKPK